MPQMHFVARDSNTGQGIPNVEVTSQYNTSPCAWYALGCTSGDGQNIQGYTDSTGVFSWSIPYTCAGSFTNTTFAANGYATQTYQSKAFGANPSDMWINVNMVPVSITNPLAPPGQGIFDSLTGPLASFAYNWDQATGSWWGALTSGGWELAVILAVVAFVIIAIAVLVWEVT
jgi:hypothetical protein